MMRTFFNRNALLVILASVFIIVVIVFVMATTSQSDALAAEEQELSALSEEMNSQQGQAAVEREEVLDAALGFSDSRVNEDTQLVYDFVRTVVTWSSGEEYTEARESVVRKYALDEGSQFLQVYFPEPVFNTDSSGTRFYVVDTDGLNSSLASVEVLPMGVSGTAYSYMVLANVSANSNNGDATASKASVIYLTVDGEGVLSEVSGYASTSKSLRSK
jgi:hypothetical protein